jgi:hypothetical protein
VVSSALCINSLATSHLPSKISVDSVLKPWVVLRKLECLHQDQYYREDGHGAMLWCWWLLEYYGSSHTDITRGRNQQASRYLALDHLSCTATFHQLGTHFSQRSRSTMCTREHIRGRHYSSLSRGTIPCFVKQFLAILAQAGRATI